QLAADVDVELPGGERVEVVAVALPVPRQAFTQHREGDVLDAFHQLDQAVVVGGLAGREADAAVAHDHGGDAVPGAGLHAPVPGGLAVVVGVDVDEAGGDQLAARVDFFGAGAGDLSNGGDAAVLDRDIGFERRLAGPVDDGPAAHDQVKGLFH